jgi:hypothetical protein
MAPGRGLSRTDRVYLTVPADRFADHKKVDHDDLR